MSYSVEIPDGAVLVERKSSAQELQHLHKLMDDALALGAKAMVVDARNIPFHPGYTCTHYAVGLFNAMVLLVKKEEA